MSYGFLKLNLGWGDLLLVIPTPLLFLVLSRFLPPRPDLPMRGSFGEEVPAGGELPDTCLTARTVPEALRKVQQECVGVHQHCPEPLSEMLSQTMGTPAGEAPSTWEVEISGVVGHNPIVGMARDVEATGTVKNGWRDLK
ncbi:unnamed protein product [Cylicostephanus goldi]|uniref:Uncharacterized protein n=1 Tax=Cylicostephanus goldi TaxID=71465 RepID=A0A3P6TZ78_CYLGO|nr:unnamed protein product [Cylicostephanus goldi]